jgi:drug/metabolite transporter (DMT)-like permease
MTSDSHSPISAPEQGGTGQHGSHHGARPVFSLLYAASFWGLLWYPLRWLEQAGISGTWQTLVSYLAAAVVMLPLLRLGRSPWRVRPPAGWLLLLASAAGWANVAFVLAVIDGEVVRVLLLFYLSPVWAALLGWLMLGERVHMITLLTVPAGLAGAFIMLWEPGTGLAWPPTVADWLAFSAGVAFALSNVAARQMGQVSVRLRTLATWVGVVVIAAVLLSLGGAAAPQAQPMAWGGALLLGAVGFFTCTSATIYGVSHMPVQRSAVIMLFEILVGGLSAWLIAGEAMAWSDWLGGALILGAGFVAATRH